MQDGEHLPEPPSQTFPTPQSQIGHITQQQNTISIPPRFKDFKIGYADSHPQKDWDEQRFKKIFGQLLAIPYKGTKIYICPFCIWKGTKAKLWSHMRMKHCCGKQQQQQSCCTCEAPLRNDLEVIEQHMNDECFGISYEIGIIQLLHACGGDNINISEIFDAFRNRSK